MEEQHAAYAGSIPGHYDRYLGPALFDPYARDLVGRLAVPEGGRVLELACGTGIVTRRLRERLPRSARLTATDLSESMIAHAAAKLAGAPIEWKQADAASLPFAPESFDAVVCQFGLMFVPDKGAAFGEAFRVLKPGGVFLFNVWDALEENDFAHVTHTTIAGFFEDDPPAFYEVPFSFHDAATIQALATGTGFVDVELAKVSLESVCASAAEAALGLVEGTPVSVAIRERRPADVSRIIAAVARALAARCGGRPARGRMRAVAVQAKKPTAGLVGSETGDVS